MVTIGNCSYTIDCNIEIIINSYSNKAIIAVTPQSPLCNAVAFVDQPYPISFTGTYAGLFTINHVKVMTYTDTCRGNIFSDWNLPFLNFYATLASDTGAPCLIQGSVVQ